MMPPALPSIPSSAGSILAVDATLTNHQNIEGGVCVKNLTQYGEIHLQPFPGNVVATTVSEPYRHTMLLMSLGWAC